MKRTPRVRSPTSPLTPGRRWHGICIHTSRYQGDDRRGDRGYPTPIVHNQGLESTPAVNISPVFVVRSHDKGGSRVGAAVGQSLEPGWRPLLYVLTTWHCYVGVTEGHHISGWHTLKRQSYSGFFRDRSILDLLLFRLPVYWDSKCTYTFFDRMVGRRRDMHRTPVQRNHTSTHRNGRWTSDGWLRVSFRLLHLKVVEGLKDDWKNPQK